MDDEIDLREYVDILVRHWKVIVGLTVLVTLAALVATLLITPTYEATAVLKIAVSGNPPSSDPLWTSTPAQVAFVQGATVAAQTLQALGKTAANETAGSLSRKVRVVGDPQDKSILRVTAQSDTAAKAAALANAWAQTGLQEMNRALKASTTKDTQIKDQQVQLAAERLKQAEQALAAFMESQGFAWEDIVAATSAQTGASQGNRPSPAGSSRPSAKQIIEYYSVIRDRDIAASIYTQLATQAIQSEIAGQSSTTEVQLADPALDPEAPVQPKRSQNVIVGGVLGLLSGVAGAFGVEYWTRRRQTPS